MPKLTEFFFATGNSHKVQEARAALSQFNIGVQKLDEFQKLEIQHLDLEEIASSALALIISRTNKPVLVEDSGLFIHQLNGFPGPYSSYVFETLGHEGILRLLEEAKTRKAEFRSSVAFGINGKWAATFSSSTEGTILMQPRGENGFGFDPIFVPLWTSKTFAEMSLKEKTIYSHRAKAISKLALWFLNESKTNPDLQLEPSTS
jgi:XTP/dITP diphosphohydrolase